LLAASWTDEHFDDDNLHEMYKVNAQWGSIMYLPIRPHVSSPNPLKGT
jgi:hypothetical protein